MTRSKVSLLLFALTGCLHRLPAAAVLAPLVPYLTQEPSDQSHGPEYVVFADQLTATVFESLKRDAHYRIIPKSSGEIFVSARHRCDWLESMPISESLLS